MTALDFFRAYLFPWVFMLGVQILLGLAISAVEGMTGTKYPRFKTLAGSVVGAGQAYILLGAVWHYSLDGLPFWAAYSLMTYWFCGLLLAVGSLVGFGALYSQMVDETKREMSGSGRGKS